MDISFELSTSQVHHIDELSLVVIVIWRGDYVIGGRIWKGVIAPWQRDNLMMRLIQVGYAAFWYRQLGEIPNTKNDEGEAIFSIPSELDIKNAKQKRDEKRLIEQQQYENSMTKIGARKDPKFSKGKTLESARLVPYDFKNDLDDQVIEDE
ncbi:MAG: hypothetical protein EZS28_025273 [Streblomastix strix]|uniref:Uncharacterized protein n=1 Tax=Streblomastix strix TaxID=222440 RepID=A0A5J4V9S8_9EUKA|nr:MAG: hypothetical protein EZS28_025273 [Streblomastix strix]